MGGDYADLFLGLVLLGVGLLLLRRRAYLVGAAIKSGNAVWTHLGIPQASERSRRMARRIIAQFIGAVWILGGLSQVVTFFEGRDWPLHFARWSDPWPF